ncbi:RWD domain-containing protein 4 [Mytilus coruscus]|uniref:RWD domain-containing protein 4 n=1 Tax=Mytilus coruscus TaxID=42192 RepID=A0A6J8C095_MYTCO|nr:RWD domain-containing protein 4 [Mytilus coruscus]
MSNKELQEEELEVLHSIYDGDDSFKQVDQTTFQYKYGEEGNHRSFVLEISWTDDYPEHSPNIKLDAFYNKHILSNVKETIKNSVEEQIPDLIGCAMTYTLFEYVKENYPELISEQPEVPSLIQIDEDKFQPDVAKKKEKKEQLTKNQKRKMYERMNAAGEKPRGYDWVDIIKHLSQSGVQT